MFFTKGVGIHKEELHSFELALRDAGIEKCNLVQVSSIMPPGCQVISRARGLKELNAGAITYCVLSRCCSNEPRRLLAASVGCAIPADKRTYGYISEHHSFGQTQRQAGDYAEDLAAAMLASTLGIDFDIDESWDEKKEIFKISGKIVSTRNITQSSIVQSHGLHHCHRRRRLRLLILPLIRGTTEKVKLPVHRRLRKPPRAVSQADFSPVRKPYSGEGKMVPNGLQTSSAYVIPPLLGFIVLLGLALISLLQGGRKRTNILFAGICLLGALLNADMALVSILPDERLALRVDRTVHFFFVFSVPIYIRFVHAFLGIRGRRWLEITAWLFSIAFLTIIPTDLYFSGFHYYSFGRIARAGVLFHLFSATVAFTVLYCLAVLYRAMRRDRGQSAGETGSSISSEGWGFPPSSSPSRSFRSAAFPSTRWGISASSPPFFSPSASSNMIFWTSAPSSAGERSISS